MRLMVAFIGILTTGLLAADVSAQDPPSFAGTWTQIVDPDAPAAAGPGAEMFGLGASATITQDDASLTIQRSTQFGQTTSVYNLDGSSRTNTVTIQDFSIPLASVTAWDAGKLNIQTTIDFQGTMVETSLSLSLDADGNLAAESTTPGFQGGGPTTTRTSYKKG